MLSDNIRKYRKKLNLSQDELAEKLGVSRQSVSFWETGQTQPTIDNIIALANVFDISTDVLLGNSNDEETLQDKIPNEKKAKKNNKLALIIASCIAIVIIVGVVIAAVIAIGDSTKAGYETTSNIETPETENSASNETSNTESTLNNTEATETESTSDSNETSETESTTGSNETSETESATLNNEATETESTSGSNETSETESATLNNEAAETESTTGSNETSETESTSPDVGTVEFDLFSYCKNFAIENGELNGDYCIYQQPSQKYGGYENEYFSISYWSNSDMVEFCLHCPLNDTQSHNFYLRMRGGYDGTYEYASSKYYRDTGESFRFAMGHIDPSVFSDSYPIPCAVYEGSTDGQTDFMEQSRVGICDLINCLKNFVSVENMDCDFSDFDFINF